jgi:LPXTG-motif cell wall-anchored protein
MPITIRKSPQTGSGSTGALLAGGLVIRGLVLALLLLTVKGVKTTFHQAAAR